LQIIINNQFFNNQTVWLIGYLVIVSFISFMPTLLYNWKIGGEAGYGIMNTGGPIFAKTLVRAGFFVFIYSEYPSLIRGGHNTMQVTVARRKIDAAYQELDQLVALNSYAIIKHQDEVKKGGVVIYDKSEIKLRKDIKFIPIDFTKIAQEVGGDKIMKNVAAVGASLRILEIGKLGNWEIGKGILLKTAKGVLKDVFAKKGDKIVKANKRVLEEGYNSISNF